MKLLKSILPNFRNNMAYWGEKPIYEFADYLIANGVTVQEWISVKDKVPENSGRYLVIRRNKYDGSIATDIETYIKCKIGEWWLNDYIYNRTHWMPLPEPPKGE